MSVALCTYNGARYLEEQLESIAFQTRPPDELIICDDRSSDGTAEIIAAFASNAPFPVRWYINEESLGAPKNFEKAMSLCEGDFIALSDQDDVWLADKLSTTLEALLGAEREHGEAMPLLVHTDLRVVDTDGRSLSPSFYKHQGFRSTHENPFTELLLENYVTGCTSMMNRALKERGLPIAREALVHDWWLALVAASSGRVISLPEVTVLYRQHGGNVIGGRKRGVRKYLFGWRSFVFRVRNRFYQSEALEAHLRNSQKCPEQVAFLSRYHYWVRRGGFHAVYWLFEQRIAMQGISRTLVIYFLLFARVFKRSGDKRRALL